MKDGSYRKLLEFSPINFELRSSEEKDRIIRQFGSALRTWPDEVHIKIITIPSDISSFIRELEARKREEESASCRILQEDQIRLLVESSSTQGVSRRFFVSFPYVPPAGIRNGQDFRQIRSRMNRQAAAITATMEACGNSLISNESTEYLLSAIYCCMCREESMRIPWEKKQKDLLQSYRKNYGRDISPWQIPPAYRIGSAFLDFRASPMRVEFENEVISFCVIPQESYPLRAAGGWLQILFGYMDNVDVDFFIEKEKAENVQRKLSLALKSNVIRQANADTISMDYEEIRSAVESGMYIKSSLAAGEDLCYMSTILTIRAPDTERLQTAFLEMKEYCIRNDLMLKRLSFRQQAAYTSCYPCSGLSESIRSITRRNIMTSGLGSCYPFTAYELCERDGIFLGLNARYGSPVFLNSFNASAYQNANMLLVGPSGSGKTYTLLCMLLRMRQKGLQIFVIAPLKGFEFYRSANAVDGEIVVIAPGSKQNINVMEIRGGQTDEVEENRVENSLLSNKIQQLHRFFSLIIPDLTSLEKQVLDNALLQTYRSFGITEDNSSIYETDNTHRLKRMPILGDLQDQLKKEGEAAERLVLLLSRFVSGSASSFNRQTNVDLSNRFVVCDCSHLTPELLPAGMFICLDYIMDRAKQSRTEKKVIAVDEMWKLMTASELSAEFVVEVFRVIRGYAGAAIGATQDIQDVVSDRSGSAIFNNSKIKLLLPMGKKEIDSIRGVMDLTQAEAENLKRPETGSDASGKRKPTKLLMAANSNHIFITVKASRMEHDLITTNSEDLIRIKQMRREEESNAV